MNAGERPPHQEHWTSVLGFRLWFCIYALIAGIVVPPLLLLDGVVRIASIALFGLLSLARIIHEAA
jgi:hypothetical protein